MILNEFFNICSLAFTEYLFIIFNDGCYLPTDLS